jgi:hypothetical protein
LGTRAFLKDTKFFFPFIFHFSRVALLIAATAPPAVLRISA